MSKLADQAEYLSMVGSLIYITTGTLLTQTSPKLLGPFESLLKPFRSSQNCSEEEIIVFKGDV